MCVRGIALKPPTLTRARQTTCSSGPRRTLWIKHPSNNRVRYLQIILTSADQQPRQELLGEHFFGLLELFQDSLFTPPPPCLRRSRRPAVLMHTRDGSTLKRTLALTQTLARNWYHPSGRQQQSNSKRDDHHNHTTKICKVVLRCAEEPTPHCEFSACQLAKL